MPNVTDADLKTFCEDQDKRYNAWLARIGCNPRESAIHSYTLGSRYARIVRKDGHASVCCFIDRTNGDILKGSWKAPVARGVRGNIFTADRGDSVMDGTGPKYLRYLR